MFPFRGQGQGDEMLGSNRMNIGLGASAATITPAQSQPLSPQPKQPGGLTSAGLSVGKITRPKPVGNNFLNRTRQTHHGGTLNGYQNDSRFQQSPNLNGQTSGGNFGTQTPQPPHARDPNNPNNPNDGSSKGYYSLGGTPSLSQKFGLSTSNLHAGAVSSTAQAVPSITIQAPNGRSITDECQLSARDHGGGGHHQQPPHLGTNLNLGNLSARDGGGMDGVLGSARGSARGPGPPGNNVNVPGTPHIPPIDMRMAMSGHQLLNKLRGAEQELEEHQKTIASLKEENSAFQAKNREVQGILQGLEAQFAECLAERDSYHKDRNALKEQVAKYREEKKIRTRATEAAQTQMKKDYEQQMSREKRNNDRWKDVEQKNAKLEDELDKAISENEHLKLVVDETRERYELLEKRGAGGVPSRKSVKGGGPGFPAGPGEVGADGVGGSGETGAAFEYWKLRDAVHEREQELQQTSAASEHAAKQKIDAMRSKLEGAESRVESLKEERRSLLKEIDGLREDLADREAESAASAREQKIMQEASSAQLAQIDGLEMALDRVQDEHEEERRSLQQQLQSEITKLEKEIEFLKEEKEAEVTGLRQELQGSESHWKEKCSKLESDADNIGKKMYQLEKELKGVSEDRDRVVGEMEKEMKTLEKERIQAEEQLDQHVTEKKEKEKQLADALSQKMEKQQEVVDILSNLKKIQEEHSKREKEMHNLEEMLERAREDADFERNAKEKIEQELQDEIKKVEEESLNLGSRVQELERELQGCEEELRRVEEVGEREREAAAANSAAEAAEKEREIAEKQIAVVEGRVQELEEKLEKERSKLDHERKNYDNEREKFINELENRDKELDMMGKERGEGEKEWGLKEKKWKAEKEDLLVGCFGGGEKWKAEKEDLLSQLDALEAGGVSLNGRKEPDEKVIRWTPEDFLRSQSTREKELLRENGKLAADIRLFERKFGFTFS